MFSLFHVGHHGSTQARLEQWERVTFGIVGFFFTVPMAFLIGSFAWNIITTWIYYSPPKPVTLICIGPFLLLMIILCICFSIAGVQYLFLLVQAILGSMRNRLRKSITADPNPNNHPSMAINDAEMYFIGNSTEDYSIVQYEHAFSCLAEEKSSYRLDTISNIKVSPMCGVTFELCFFGMVLSISSGGAFVIVMLMVQTIRSAPGRNVIVVSVQMLFLVVVAGSLLYYVVRVSASFLVAMKKCTSIVASCLDNNKIAPSPTTVEQDNPPPPPV